jgi:hypothetical protein
MARPWRRAAVAALAGAAAIAAQFTTIAPAQAAAPTITIFATAKLPPVTHEVIVFFKDGAFATAKIHGKITGAKAGEVAVLYGQEFPYKHPAVRVGAVTLKSTAPVYSFTVIPVLATRYAVRLFASGTSKAPLATSAVQNVYVGTGGFVTGGTANCARPLCFQNLHVFTVLPSSALSTEMGKHFYTYFGLNLSTTGEPPPPKFANLGGGNPVVSAAKRINAGEYEVNVSFSFTIGNDGWFWVWDGCVRDTESRDGLGLPGHHGCGTLTRIPTNVFTYLG